MENARNFYDLSKTSDTSYNLPLLLKSTEKAPEQFDYICCLIIRIHFYISCLPSSEVDHSTIYNFRLVSYDTLKLSEPQIDSRTFHKFKKTSISAEIAFFISTTVGSRHLVVLGIIESP